jgi:hypothetical protein
VRIRTLWRRNLGHGGRRWPALGLWMVGSLTMQETDMENRDNEIVLSERELDCVTGGDVKVSVPAGAVTAQMYFGGNGLFVWATPKDHGFVVVSS